jgi:HSP20 family molecular chaperone IbpA
VDIVEGADELTLYAELPGVRSKDISIHFEDGTLTIHGIVSERQGERTTFLHREYGVGDFHRTFEVSEVVDAERIGAEFSDGVLTIHLPKVEAVKPRKIEVKTG